MKAGRIAVHRALVAPLLRAGMEPKWAGMLVLVDLIFLVFAHPATAIAAALWTAGGWWAGRALVKVDPQMMDVYFRHLRREWSSDGGYVPAQSEPGAQATAWEPEAKRAVAELG